jgi:hypothetical protein
MGEQFMHYHPNRLVREYNDRGMAKWLGFYLSEHTAEMKKDTSTRDAKFTRNLKEKMSATAIDTCLTTAFQTNRVVTIQLAELDLSGLPLADIRGVVTGFNENNLYLSTQTDTLQMIPIEEINHVVLEPVKKWSE